MCIRDRVKELAPDDEDTVHTEESQDQENTEISTTAGQELATQAPGEEVEKVKELAPDEEDKAQTEESQGQIDTEISTTAVQELATQAPGKEVDEITGLNSGPSPEQVVTRVEPTNLFEPPEILTITTTLEVTEKV